MDHLINNLMHFQGYISDPIVWLLIIRTAASVGVSVLFFLEPMRCGGENKRFHQFIGVFFALFAWTGWDRIMARVDGLVDGAAAFIPAMDIFWSQFSITVATVFLAGWLSYEWFKGKQYKNMKMSRSPAECGSCPRKFEP